VYFLSDNRLVVASNCQILGLGQVRRLEATLLQALGHLQDATPGIDQNSLIATWLGINDPYNTTPAEVPIQFYAQAEGVFQRTYMPTDLVYSNALTGIVTVPEPSPYHLRFALGGYEGRDLGATLLWDGEYVMQQEYLAPGQVLFLETWELPPNRGAHSMSYQESGWASPLDTGTRFFDLVTHEETAGTITLTMDSGQIGRTLRAQPIGDSALPE
jgi:hypothetical protein